MRETALCRDGALDHVHVLLLALLFLRTYCIVCIGLERVISMKVVHLHAFRE